MPKKKRSDDKFEDWIQLGGLWKGQKKGVLSGQLDGYLEIRDIERAIRQGYRLLLLPAKTRSSDRSPTHRIWLVPDDDEASGGRRQSRGRRDRRDRDDDDDRGRRRRRSKRNRDDDEEDFDEDDNDADDEAANDVPF